MTSGYYYYLFLECMKSPRYIIYTVVFIIFLYVMSKHLDKLEEQKRAKNVK